MKTLIKLSLILGLVSFAAQAQTNTLVQTTLAAANSTRGTVLKLTSVTGVNAPTFGVPASMLYIIDKGGRVGQLFQVAGISGTNVTVVPRGSGAIGNAHASGALVLVATSPDWFYTSNPSGPCVGAATAVNVQNVTTPYLNTNTGEQWLCSSVTSNWVPGWGNSSAPQDVTAAVASVAGATALSGPFFHMTGTNAVTGFTIPIGFVGGCVTIVADAIWTWTAAGNILTAGTTTAAGRYNRFCWDSNAAKFVPDKVI